MCVPETRERVGFIDEVRGIAILLMVVYHTFYDLVVLFGLDLPVFYSAELGVVRDVFAGLFIFISGTACRFSRNNLKRGVLCFALGMLMTYVTAIVMPSTQILFGILHLLGISMIVAAFLLPYLDKINHWVGMILCAVLFLLTMNLSRGYFGLPGGLGISFSADGWGQGLLFPFGLLSNGFYSSDYFPLFPWLFVFFAGIWFGKLVVEHKLPDFCYRTHLRPLAWVGRHTIWIYLLHQPVVYGVLYAIYYLVGQK